MARPCSAVLSSSDTASVFSGGPRLGPVSRSGFDINADAAGYRCDAEPALVRKRVPFSSFDETAAGAAPSAFELRAWCIGDASRPRRGTSEPPPARSTGAEAAMQAFGVPLDIDACERGRVRKHDAENGKQAPSSTERAQAAWRVGDIEGLFKKKHFASPLGHSDISRSQSAAELGLVDIDAHMGRRRVSERLESAASGILPDVSKSWDASVGDSPLATRRRFFEQHYWADRWAVLLDRPRKGNAGSVWLPENRKGLNALAFSEEIGSTRSSLKSSKKEPLNAALCASLLSHACHVLKEDDEGSEASTISGHGENSDLYASTPEFISDTSGTASPDIVDSESDDGFVQLVNDPKGQHRLLQEAGDENRSVACKPLDAPLAFRRVLSAVLPADCENYLQLSSSQMQKLSEMRDAISANKQKSGKLATSQMSQSTLQNRLQTGTSRARKSPISIRDSERRR